MEMKMIDTGLEFLLIVGMKLEERPYIHGYSNAQERDNSFNQFLNDGELTLLDEEIGAMDTIEPLYVICADKEDGAINSIKIQ